ncbi:hypothetical protein JW766_01420 [Candidatus Dojkabacteria bacterium]|nr:hypothetical protein [Candidatus Dojkabacteria bacterium]
MKNVKIKTKVIIFPTIIATTLTLLPITVIHASSGCGSHIDNGDGTCTAVFDNPSEDATIENLDGLTFTKETSTEYLTTGIIYFIEGYQIDRAYAEWDISSIPDGVTIIDTLFRYHGQTDGDDNSQIISLMNYQPTTRPAQDLYDDIETEPAYLSLWNPVVAPNQEVDLGTDADNDVQSQLANDWFALGFLNEESTQAEYDEIRSEDNTGNPTPPPTLVVTYEGYTPSTTMITQLPETSESSQLFENIFTGIILLTIGMYLLTILIEQYFSYKKRISS